MMNKKKRRRTATHIIYYKQKTPATVDNHCSAGPLCASIPQRLDMAMTLPTDRVLRVSPFPSCGWGWPVSLAGLVKGETSVLHLYTGWGGCWPCALPRGTSGQQAIQNVNFVTISCSGPQHATLFASRCSFSMSQHRRPWESKVGTARVVDSSCWTLVERLSVTRP